MYGTDLCRAYRERLPDCQIIFISGYADKEYLTAAIELGAVSYIEKPIDLQELSDALEKAAGNIHKVESVQKSALHALLFSREQDRPSAVEMYRSALLRGAEEEMHHVLLLIRSKEETPEINTLAADIIEEISAEYTDNRFSSMTDVVTGGVCTILLTANRTWSVSMRESICMTCLSYATENSRWFLSISANIEQLSQLPEEYRTASEALECLSWKGWNSYVLAETVQEEKTWTVNEETIRLFSQLLGEKQYTEAEAIARDCCRQQSDACARMSFAVRNIWYTLDHEISRAERKLHLTGEAGETEETAFLDEAQTIDALRDYVLDHLRRIKTQENEADPEQRQNYAVKKVCEYIYQHLGEEDLTVGILADSVYLTSTYLSSLFRKVMGVTLIQYITDMRMQRACELLKDPAMKLYQVADKVGYSDAKYFARQFKKTIGMTPSEYRERL